MNNSKLKPDTCTLYNYYYINTAAIIVTIGSFAMASAKNGGFTAIVPGYSRPTFNLFQLVLIHSIVQDETSS